MYTELPFGASPPARHTLGSCVLMRLVYSTFRFILSQGVLESVDCLSFHSIKWMEAISCPWSQSCQLKPTIEATAKCSYKSVVFAQARMKCLLRHIFTKEYGNGESSVASLLCPLIWKSGGRDLQSIMCNWDWARSCGDQTIWMLGMWLSAVTFLYLQNLAALVKSDWTWGTGVQTIRLQWLLNYGWCTFLHTELFWELHMLHSMGVISLRCYLKHYMSNERR